MLDRKPTLYAKRWWSPELTEHRRKIRQAVRRAYKYKDNPNHPSHKEARKAWNEYSQKIKDTKKKH